jgi:hypothetical protein
MLAAHDVPLKRPVVDLPPARVQTGKNLILAPALKRLDLTEAKLSEPLSVGEHVAHGLVKHGHGHGSVFHQSTQHHFHVLSFGSGGVMTRPAGKAGRADDAVGRCLLPCFFLQGRGLRLGVNDIFENGGRHRCLNSELFKN